MTTIEKGSYREQMRFVAPLFDDAQNLWLGDVFAFKGGAFFVPPLPEIAQKASLQNKPFYWCVQGVPCVAYDFKAAQRIVEGERFAARVADERFAQTMPRYTLRGDICLDKPFAVADGLRDYLYLARYNEQFGFSRDLRGNEAICVALSASGVQLPQVIDSGSISVLPDGYEGPCFLVREGQAWRTLSLAGSYHFLPLPDGKKKGTYTLHDLFAVSHAYMAVPAHGRESPCYFDEVVAEDTLQAVHTHLLLDTLARADYVKQTSDTTFGFFSKNDPFSIAAHIVLNRAQGGPVKDALVVTTAEPVRWGHKRSALLVPIERSYVKGDGYALNLRADQAKNVVWQGEGLFTESTTSLPKGEIADYLQSKLCSHRPTWDVPVTVSVVRDPA